MDNKNFYEILEIREDASVREIRDAYKKKVKEWHPDVNSCKGFRQCHKMMCDINEAYTHLIDPELRKLHDEVLAERTEEAYQKATSKKQPENTSRSASALLSSTKYFDYYDLDDYEEDEKESFVSWLNMYYYQLVNVLTGFISLEDLNKLIEGFESIINYEKILLQRRKKRYKSL